MANKIYLFYISKNYKDQSLTPDLYVFDILLFGILDIKKRYFDLWLKKLQGHLLKL